MPVSATENAITDFDRLSSMLPELQPLVALSMVSRTEPCSVNLSALESRFLSTCCRRLASVCMISDPSELPSSIVKSRPLPSATCRKVFAAVILQFGEPHAAHFHVHLAGFDLAQIQNVVDQRQQVGSGGVNGFGELHLLGRQVLVRVFRQHARQNQKIVERRAQLVAHVGQEFALVLGSERKLFGLFFQRLLGLLHFLVLGFDFGLLLGQQLRFFLQFGVGLLQLKLLALQLLGQRLALLAEVARSAWWRRWCSARCRWIA